MSRCLEGRHSDQVYFGQSRSSGLHFSILLAYAVAKKENPPFFKRNRNCFFRLTDSYSWMNNNKASLLYFFTRQSTVQRGEGCYWLKLAFYRVGGGWPEDKSGSNLRLTFPRFFVEHVARWSLSLRYSSRKTRFSNDHFQLHRNTCTPLKTTKPDDNVVPLDASLLLV